MNEKSMPNLGSYMSIITYLALFMMWSSTVFAASDALSVDALDNKQKIIFCVDSYKYGLTNEDSCKKECYVKCDLNGFILEGWKIDNKIPKEITKVEWTNYLLFKSGCTCIGMEYVLSKDRVK